MYRQGQRPGLTVLSLLLAAVALWAFACEVPRTIAKCPPGRGLGSAHPVHDLDRRVIYIFLTTSFRATVVNEPAGHHSFWCEPLLTPACPKIVQADLFVAAALHVRDTDSPILETGRTFEMGVKGVLVEVYSKGRDLVEHESTIYSACPVLQPVLVRQENIFALFVHDCGYLPQRVVVFVDQRGVGVEHQDVCELLRTEHVIPHHEVLLPIEVLALVLLHTLLEVFHETISPLPLRELGLSRLRSENHDVAMTPSMIAIRR
mmetsp:Transcript_20179/g.44045  ORF Transcript_20179/g.44045 Transcript_20179/m.44045 type:complete len:261 (-) Transcript_20179:544-1326(-)